MLSFEFSPDQDLFRATPREFAAAELAPGYRERAASARFPWQLYARLALRRQLSP